MITTAKVDVEQVLAALCGVLNQSYARPAVHRCPSPGGRVLAMGGPFSGALADDAGGGSARFMPGRSWRWPGGTESHRR